MPQFVVRLLIIIVLDTTTEWGLMSSVEQPRFSEPGKPSQAQLQAGQITFTSTSAGAKDPAANSVHDPVPIDFLTGDRPNTNAHKPRIPEFNRPRIVKPTAAKAIAPKYATWLANEDYQDHLKLQSYVKDQRAVIPGKLPAAPVYGPSRELQLRVSPNFPTVYVQRITPSDIEELMNENQTLRNKVLERMWACNICNTEFKNHDNTSIREHGQEHIKQIQEAGECPLCGSVNWAFMTMDQRREHFKWHIFQENASAKQSPWQELQCPACDRDFSIMHPESIIDHCLKHTPSVVQYCDKCGLHVAKCTKEELTHHQLVCRSAPERKKNDPEPVFCESCGKDTSNQTEIQMILHMRDCQNRPTASSKAFCTRCGLDTTMFNNMQLASHTSRCAVPRGVKRKFCGRCSTDLSEMGSGDKSSHKRICLTGSLALFLKHLMKVLAPHL
jgi:hypothetical protein